MKQSYFFYTKHNLKRGEYMNFKKYGLRLLYTVGTIIIVIAFFTILYYFNLMKEPTYRLCKILTVLITILINSIFLGKQAKKKGYLEGIKFGGILILCLLIPTIITNSFQTKTILYYILILGTSIIGSMIGINQKKK